MLQVLEHRLQGVLKAGRPVVVAGDLNIAPYAIDHCDFVRAPAHIQAGMLRDRPDRAWFRRILHHEGGPLVDLYRHVPCMLCHAICSECCYVTGFVSHMAPAGGGRYEH